MALLVWNDPLKKTFEAGLDRGVFYPSGGTPAAWQGLIAVDENSSGGESVGQYIDGRKYLNNVAPEEYTATISAFSAPPGFDACEGYGGSGNGLYFGQQPRKAFGMSYRTGVGNSLKGGIVSHEIHLVYNALTLPSVRNRKTLTNTAIPATLTWPVTVLPIPISGRRATAHLVIKTAELTTTRLANLEKALYGSATTAPYLPTPTQLLTMLGA